MRTPTQKRLRYLPIGILSGLLVLTSLDSPKADTVTMKHGYQIHGSIDEAMSNDKQLIVNVGKQGKVILKRSRVQKIEKNQKTGVTPAQPAVPVPAVTEEMVTIKLKDNPYYSSISSQGLSGVQKRDTDGQATVLEIPGVGQIRIPDAIKAETVPYQAPQVGVAAVAASEGKIKTTHQIRMKSNAIIKGNIVSDPKKSPVIVQIGHLGTISLNLNDIAGYDVLEGEYELPPPPAPDPEPQEQEVQKEPEVEETQPQETSKKTEEAPVPQAIVKQIETQLYEITRHRHQNRARGERKLKAMGKVVTPFLAKTANHSSEWTRIITMRVLKEVGDERGLPMAIGALTDSNHHVRQVAHEALKKITGNPIKGYHHKASPLRLKIAQKKLVQQFLKS